MTKVVSFLLHYRLVRKRTQYTSLSNDYIWVVDINIELIGNLADAHKENPKQSWSIISKFAIKKWVIAQARSPRSQAKKSEIILYNGKIMIIM